MLKKRNHQNRLVEKTLQEIAQGINSGKTVVFCGAGISRNSGLPVVNQLAPYILNKLNLDEKYYHHILDEDNCPYIPFEAFIECIADASDASKLLDIYDKGEPNTNHLFLARLIKAGKLKTVITTNFDTLIEQALSQEPNKLIENIDYDVIYKEDDFDKINWDDQRIRIIKIHGSVHEKNLMAITLKQVASKTLSENRWSVIRNIFRSGQHENTLVIGYSSSDIFDLSPQIQSLSGNLKKVYYLQHAELPHIEDIKEQKYKNPFVEYKDSKRIFFNTDSFIKKIWADTLPSLDDYLYLSSDTNWKENVNNWYEETIQKHSKSIAYGLPANMIIKLGSNMQAKELLEKAIRVAVEESDKTYEAIWKSTKGAVSFQLGEFNNSIKEIEEAIEIQKQNKKVILDDSFYGNLGNAYIMVGKYKKAIKIFEKAISISKKNDQRNICAWLGGIANAYAQVSLYEKATDYYIQALNIAQRLGDKLTECRTLGNLGNIFELTGEYESAKSYYEDAISIAKNISDKSNIGLWLGNIGKIYLATGNYQKAIESFQLALKTVKEIGEKHSIGTWLGNLGNAYLSIGDIKTAESYLSEALEIAESINDKYGMAARLGNLATIYQYQQNNIKAFNCYSKALSLCRELHDRVNEGINMANMGLIVFQNNEYNKSLEYLKEALAIAQEVGDKKNEAMCWGNIGNVYLAMGNFKLAMNNFENAYQKSKKINDVQNQGLWLGNIGVIYLNTGEFSKARKHIHEALNILKGTCNPDHQYVKTFEYYLQMAKSHSS